MNRLFIQFCLGALLALFPLFARASGAFLRQTVLPPDTTIVFRFAPGSLEFNAPYMGNDEAILVAGQLIDQYRQDIVSGKAYVRIRGFCGSYGSKAENLAVAKERSNHVKSWFILYHGMKEAYYRTFNSTVPYQGMTDVVALMGLEYVDGCEPAPVVAEPVQEPEPEPQPEAEPVQEPDEEAETVQPEPVGNAQASAPLSREEAVPFSREYVASPWYLKTNLLYDAVLMPSLEVEYRFNERWSAAVEGNMAWWHNNPKHKYYQLATILPEGRYWFKPQGNRRGHYVGLMAGGGWYDLENGGRGYKGEGFLAGLTYGYLFPVGKYFAFEASIGVGYMRTWYDEYLPIDGHYVYQQSSRMNYFGPVKLRFAWVWNIGRWAEKGGKR